MTGMPEEGKKQLENMEHKSYHKNRVTQTLWVKRPESEGCRKEQHDRKTLIEVDPCR